MSKEIKLRVQVTLAPDVVATGKAMAADRRRSFSNLVESLLHEEGRTWLAAGDRTAAAVIEGEEGGKA